MIKHRYNCNILQLRYNPLAVSFIPFCGCNSGRL